MTIIDTDEFGRCLSYWSAKRFLEGQGVCMSEQRNGALVFTYSGQEQRTVLPLYIKSTGWSGWAWAEDELRRDYVKPEPEKKVIDVQLGD